MFLLESLIAEQLASGQNLEFEEGYVHFDDRLLQKAWVSRLKSCPEIIVLGSSTTMQLTSSVFPNQTFLNHSVRRGVQEDYLAMTQLYRDREWKPKKVILGLDSWIFDPTHWRSYWKSLSDEYERLATDYHISWQTKKSSIFSAEYILSCLQEFGTVIGWRKLLLIKSLLLETPEGVIPTKENFEKGYVKRFDGSVGYHVEFRDQSTEQVASVIENSKKFPAFSISSSSFECFSLYIQRLILDGVTPVFYLPALHPKIFELNGFNLQGEAIENYDHFLKILNKVEKSIRTLADSLKVDVVGSYRPDLQLVSGEDFYDWIHLKPNGVEKIFKQTQ